MRTIFNEAPAMSYSQPDYERAVVNSALWAAAGDAIGWMTELTRGPSGVAHRTGSKTVTEPIAWQRHIGGRAGVRVDLPAGTYSDDTQLRLSVSRSIRANGAFDVEAFAKVEITSWQGYCLGAGVGSKAAAANLSKRGVNWFSNFFSTDRQKYVTAGGNGAAMRIQPHVWAAHETLDELVLRVMRDAIVTHGHPHGFCGAIFHALCLWETLASRALPTVQIAKQFVSYIDRLPGLLERDNELSSFWRPTWEREAGKSLVEAIQAFREEALLDLEIVDLAFSSSQQPDYHDILDQLGCLSDRFRGSGFKTALAALVLSLMGSPQNVEAALEKSANELESDTDTIATMAGALLGVLAERAPKWEIQDAEYLKTEAKRMVSVARREPTTSFSYPDVSVWEPPSNQSDAVVFWNGALALSGIGRLEPRGKEYSSGSSVWQWFNLPFGQSVLAKRRMEVRASVDDAQMPREPILSKPKGGVPKSVHGQNSFDFVEQAATRTVRGSYREDRATTKLERFPGLDKATDIIISSGFDDAVIGRLLNLCIDETGQIETAVSLSAIVAKARLSRLKRR